jgi:hypothetical protein
MHSMLDDMDELRVQLEKGSIQRAYAALLAYMLSLRTYLVNKYGISVVSNLYQGYLDMTYFAIFPHSLKDRGLKVAVVFNYNAFRFEAWLAARNRVVQRQYWEVFKDSQWPEYRVVAPAKGIDSIIEYDLAADFDLASPENLTETIEKGTAEFIADMEKFLSEAQTGK